MGEGCSVFQALLRGDIGWGVPRGELGAELRLEKSSVELNSALLIRLPSSECCA